MYQEIFEIIKDRLDNNTALNAFLADRPVYGFSEEIIDGKMPYLILEIRNITESPEPYPNRKAGKVFFEIHGKLEKENQADLLSDSLHFTDLIFNALDCGPDFTSGGELVTVNNSLESNRKIGTITREIVIIVEIDTNIFTEGDR